MTVMIKVINLWPSNLLKDKLLITGYGNERGNNAMLLSTVHSKSC